jgi:hypothetical protein
MAINANVASIDVITAASASDLKTAVNTAIAAINTAGTSAVTAVHFDLEKLPGNVVQYVAVLVINGITA